MKPTIVVLAIIFLTACASSSQGGWRMPDSDGASQAPGEAFTADGMNFRKNMPHQEKVTPWDFYYKHCAMNGNEAFYSKTSYDCSGPTF